jgi:DNA-binding NarL/FixJ family response regulator
MTAPCRILLVDDHDVVRHGIRTLLEGRSDFEICGEARTGREAVIKTQELKPDIVLMDVIMPELNGLDATRQIGKTVPQTKVLIISQHESGELLRQVVDAGARGYVLKADSERELLGALEAVCQNRTCFRQPSEFSVTHPPVERQVVRHPLTSREREVIQLLAEGKSSKEVAATLSISVKTAETHRANIMRKLNLHSVSDLVRYAIRNNIAHA